MSPRAKGCITGAFYLAIFVAGGIYSSLIPKTLLLNNCYTIALVFFGCYDLLIGYIAFTSTFTPRPIGILMGITCLGRGSQFVSPPIAAHPLPYYITAGATAQGPMLPFLCFFWFAWTWLQLDVSYLH